MCIRDSYTRDLPNSRALFEVNARRIRTPLAYGERIATAADARENAGKIVRTLRTLLELPEGKFAARSVRPMGRAKLAGFAVEKLALETDPGVLVPAILIRPAAKAGAKTPAVVWISHRGKGEVIRARWGELSKLLAAGVTVMAIDYRGAGETAPGTDLSFMGDETSLNGFGYRIGVPLIGMRVRDVLCSVEYLRGRPDVDPNRIALVGDSFSATNPAAIAQPRILTEEGRETIHRADSTAPAVTVLALALDERIAGAVTRGLLASYASICAQGYFYHPQGSFVPGILRHCDVADVAASSAPRPLMLAGSVNGLNQALGASAGSKGHRGGRPWLRNWTPSSDRDDARDPRGGACCFSAASRPSWLFHSLIG